MTNAVWVKSKANTWLRLLTFNINSDLGNGVYVIWHSGNPGRVVYVGQGDIATRLQCHRNNDDIIHYSQRGELLVTWAVLPAHLMSGVERYLADTWNPLVGDAYPDVAPIAVNSPW